MAAYNEIYTIGREFGSLGKRLAKNLLNVLELKFTTKNYLPKQQNLPDYAKKYLKIMMKNLQTVFYIHW